jgi:hypothetical protein
VGSDSLEDAEWSVKKKRDGACVEAMALLNWLPSQLPSRCDCYHGELFERELLHGKVHNVKSSAQLWAGCRRCPQMEGVGHT